MKPSDTDPYSTPTAVLKNETALNDPTQIMQAFPRFSAWAVFGLAIITMGLYYVWWLYSRTKIINQVHYHKIPPSLIYIVFILLAANIGISILSELEPSNMNYTMASNITSIFYSISSIYWVFAVRNRIHQMTKADVLSGCYLGGIMTFIFQVLYIQYKINEYIDRQSTSATLTS